MQAALSVFAVTHTWDICQLHFPSALFSRFVFIMGTSIALALGSMLRWGSSKWKVLRKIVWRSFVLILLGVIVVNPNYCLGPCEWNLLSLLHFCNLLLPPWLGCCKNCVSSLMVSCGVLFSSALMQFCVRLLCQPLLIVLVPFPGLWYKENWDGRVEVSLVPAGAVDLSSPWRRVLYLHLSLCLLLFHTVCLPVSWDNLRIPGVLQRLGFTYLVVAALELLFTRADSGTWVSYVGRMTTELILEQGLGAFALFWAQRTHKKWWENM